MKTLKNRVIPPPTAEWTPTGSRSTVLWFGVDDVLGP